MKVRMQVLQRPASLDECLFNADGEVEQAECMEQYEDQTCGSMSLNSPLELEFALELCLLNADGEVEAEACVRHAEEQEEEQEEEQGDTGSVPPLTSLEKAIAVLRATLERVRPAERGTAAAARAIEGLMAELDVCLLSAEGEVEMASCVELHEFSA